MGKNGKPGSFNNNIDLSESKYVNVKVDNADKVKMLELIIKDKDDMIRSLEEHNRIMSKHYDLLIKQYNLLSRWVAFTFTKEK